MAIAQPSHRRKVKRSSAIQRLLLVAGAIAVVDLLSKWVASVTLAGNPLVLTPWMSLSLVANQGGAFGLDAGSYTWQLNMALTLCAIVFCLATVRDMKHVDRSAPTALGLIMGGAIGNLLSLIQPPVGVLDFVSLHNAAGSGIVLNLADVAAYSGLALLARTGVRIVLSLRRGEEENAAIGSLYAEKRQAKRELGVPVDSPVSDVMVHDWDNVADLGIVRADRLQEDPVPRPLSRVVTPVQEIPAPPLRLVDD